MRSSKYQQIYDVYPYLKHPEKYKGTRPITLRSGWEIAFVIKYLDVNDNIIEWGSESVVISYFRPDDGKKHRYFMDFNFKAKTTSGKIKEFWVEIKPQSQIDPPKEPKRKTKTYVEQVKTYLVNQAKWKTTRQLVEEKKLLGKDIEFLVLSEKDCPFFIK